LDGALNVVDVVDGLFFVLEGAGADADTKVEAEGTLDMDVFTGELGGEGSLDGGCRTAWVGSSTVIGCTDFVAIAVLGSSVSASGSLVKG
jgi:hypothetical protein